LYIIAGPIRCERDAFILELGVNSFDSELEFLVVKYPIGECGFPCKGQV
jgi:hypothetical protein